jgi:hypothetical protein
MSDVVPSQHSFHHAPAALRIFRFAADSAPRVLELAHVSAFLRECAVEFGSADAALPGAMRNEYARGRFFKLREIVEHNAARCPWLAAKVLACRSGAPMPPAALTPDVTRHDVNWGAEGARRSDKLQLTHDGLGLQRSQSDGYRWAQGAPGVRSGKHWFSVLVSRYGEGLQVGWVDDKVTSDVNDWPGRYGTQCSGAEYSLYGAMWFGTAPVAKNTFIGAPANEHPCVVGCLLDLDATPARMTVFVDGEPLAVQCEYDFPKDGRAWYPSVALQDAGAALHSCTI